MAEISDMKPLTILAIVVLAVSTGDGLVVGVGGCFTSTGPRRAR